MTRKLANSTNKPDILIGDDKNNVINGQGGNDTITGAGGKDTLTGGADADTFVYLAASDSAANKNGKFSGRNGDIITDFKTATDKIDLTAFGSSLAFGEKTAGQNKVWFDDVKLANNKKATDVFVDTNGDGAADMVIRLLGNKNLSARDFIFAPAPQKPVLAAPAKVDFLENATGTVYTATSSMAVTWSLEGDDAALFAIDSTTGKITFSEVPDFEKPADKGANNIFDVTIKATTAQGAVATQALEITLKDIDDTPPAINTFTFGAITGDGTINIADVAGRDTTLTGSLGVFDAGGIATVTVKVTIGDKTYDADVTADRTSWSLTRPVSELVALATKSVSATVTVNDTAGLTTSRTETRTFTVDTDAPTVPALTINDIAGDGTINLEESGETTTTIGGTIGALGQGDTVKNVKVTIGAETFDATVNADGTWTLDVATTKLTAQTQVSATITVEDAAGNSATTTPAVNKTYAVDTTAPTVPTLTINDVTSGNVINSAESQQTTTTIGGTIGALGQGDTVKNVKVTIGAETFDATVNADGTWTLDVATTKLTAQTQVSATITVEDAAGNSATTTPAVNKTYAVDTTAPTVPALTINDVTSGNVINSAESQQTTTTIGGTIGALGQGDTVKNVKVTIGAETFDATVNADGTWTLDVATNKLTAQTQVSATITVEDAAGNSATTTPAVNKTYAVDTTAPTVPTLTINDVTSGNVINSAESQETTTTIGGTIGALGQGDTVKNVKVTIGAETFDATVNADGTWTLDVATNKLTAQTQVSATITVEDAAGNSATTTPAVNKTYAVDTTAPTVPALTINDVTSGNVINSAESQQTTTTIGGTIGALGQGDTVKNVKVTIGAETFDATVNADGTWTLDVATNKLTAQTQVSATITVEDAAGNSATTTPAVNKTYAVDTDAAAPTGLDLADDDVTASDKASNITSKITGLTISGAAEEDSTVTLFDDKNNNGVFDAGDVNLGNVVAGANGFNKDIDLDEGVHNIRAFATDEAGNISVASVVLAITVDTTGPTITADDTDYAENGVGTVLPATADETVTWAIDGSGDDDTKLTIDADGKLTFINAPDFENPASAAGNNTYVVKIKATDAAGNVSTKEVAITVTDTNEAPVVTNVPANLPIEFAENQASNTVIFDFNATDAENDAVSWSLTGDDAALFGIDTDGKLTFNASADFELERDKNRDGIYSFNVVANANGKSDAQAVTVKVTDMAASDTVTIMNAAVPDSIRGFKILGADAGDNSGWSVSSAGDVNGDGLDDLFIGAHKASGDAGKAYVIFGKQDNFTDLTLSDSLGQSGLVLLGSGTEQAGRSISSAGDINGDGIADMIIGSPEFFTQGITTVVFGKTGLQGTAALSGDPNIDGFHAYGFFSSDFSGRTVSSAGDLNGDGLDDIAIGAFGAGNVQPGEGKTFILYGKTDLPASVQLADTPQVPGFTLFGTTGNEQSSLGLSSAGDFNGDGLDDLIVGTHFAGPQTSGKASLIFGDANNPGNLTLSNSLGQRGFTLFGEPFSNSRAGYSVATAGDINGDGYDDIIVGAPYTPEGRSYVIYGNPGSGGVFSNIQLGLNMGTNIGFAITGAVNGDRSGFSVSSAGDVNGDGLDDLIVGAINAGAGNGRAYVIFGKTTAFTDINLGNLGPKDGFIISGADSGDQTGISVSSAGDINGDGFDDLIVGARAADKVVGIDTREGVSYVIYGSAFGKAATPVQTNGTAADDKLIGGWGNDIITNIGTGDAARGGRGDDVLEVSGTGFIDIDGGNGKDTLKLLVGSLDLTQLRSKVTSIETIDLTASGTQTVTLSRNHLLKLSEDTAAGVTTLTIKGTAADAVNFTDDANLLDATGWVKQSGPGITLDGETYAVWTNGAARLLVDADIQVPADTTPPAKLAVTLAGAENAAIPGFGLIGNNGGTNSLTPIIRGTGAEVDGTVEVTISTIGTDANYGGAGKSYNATILNDGSWSLDLGAANVDDLAGAAGDTYTIQVTHRDAANNATVSDNFSFILLGKNLFTSQFNTTGNADCLVAEPTGSIALGGDGNDTLIGAGAADTLLGEADDDILSGSGGTDNLQGGAGDDRLDGGDDADIIEGGAGADVLTGGAGADQFSFAAGDTDPANGIIDTITDFVSGTDTLSIGFNVNLSSTSGTLITGPIAFGYNVDFANGRAFAAYNINNEGYGYLAIDMDQNQSYDSLIDVVIRIDGYDNASKLALSDFVNPI